MEEISPHLKFDKNWSTLLSWTEDRQTLCNKK